MDKNINKYHLEDLNRSGLNTQTIRMAKIHSVSPEEAKKISGRKEDIGSGLAFPYPGINGKNTFTRLKPDKPPPGSDGEPAKYLTTTGAGNRLYIPVTLAPNVLVDAGIPLLITEGEKKAPFF